MSMVPYDANGVFSRDLTPSFSSAPLPAAPEFQAPIRDQCNDKERPVSPAAIPTWAKYIESRLRQFADR